MLTKRPLASCTTLVLRHSLQSEFECLPFATIYRYVSTGIKNGGSCECRRSHVNRQISQDLSMYSEGDKSHVHGPGREPVPRFSSKRGYGVLPVQPLGLPMAGGRRGGGGGTSNKLLSWPMAQDGVRVANGTSNEPNPLSTTRERVEVADDYVHLVAASSSRCSRGLFFVVLWLALSLSL